MPSLPPDDTLLVFVGHSSDADEEAKAISALERDIQCELNARLEVMPDRPRFTKVAVWEWNSDASPYVGGQAHIINPYLNRANIAIFVFKERIGEVTWKELDECRRRRTIPMIAVFAAQPLAATRMHDIDTVDKWKDLLLKKRSLTSDWTAPDSRSLLPIQDFEDPQHLKRLVMDHVKKVLGGLLRRDDLRIAEGNKEERTTVTSSDELRIAYENTTHSRHPCPGVTIEDVDWDMVQQFYGSSVANKSLGQLEEFGLISPLSRNKDKQLHYSAVLCFCSQPHNAIPQARSCFTLGALQGEQVHRVDVTGPLSRQINELQRLVLHNLMPVSSFGDAGLREDDSEIPKRLVRELLSNAIAHRDYRAHGIVHVSLTTDLLEIANLGSFPGGVSWNWMLKQQVQSCPADPAIAWYLTKLLALEGVGRGFRIIREFIKQYGKKAVTCQQSHNPPVVTIRVKRLRRRRADSDSVRNARKPRFWTRLFKPTFRLACPYCLEKISTHDDTPACLSCKHKLPLRYVLEYKDARAIFIPIIGWPATGKTTLVHAALHAFNNLATMWSGFVNIPVTDQTLAYQREVRETLSLHALPPKTSLRSSEPLILLLKGMPRWGKVLLSLYDSAGEYFQDFQAPGEQLRFLTRSQTVILTCSMPDVELTRELSVDETLQAYVNALLRLGNDRNRERRRVVVVLTKADMMLNVLPTPLVEYLTSPLIQPTTTSVADTENGLKHYFEMMDRVSQLTEEWFTRQAGGQSLINLARSQNIDLRFTICSALGGAPNEENRMQADLQPSRVLDPFFWLFESTW